MNPRPADGDYAVRRAAPRSHKPLFKRIAVALFVLVLVGGAGWWSRTSTFFQVSRVESGAYRFTSQVELEAALEGVLGQNIWQVSEEDVQELLIGLPWLRDLRLHRRLPSTIRIDFREWRPLLEVRNANATGDVGAMVLLEDGRVMEFPFHMTLAGLPVLVGVELLREGESAVCFLDSLKTSNLLELVSAFKEAGLEAHCPVDFIVDQAEGYSIVLQNGQGNLLVGRKEFANRLRRYVDARSHLEPGLEVDLRFSDRITTRAPLQLPDAP